LPLENKARCWWLTPLILAMREAEIGRIEVLGEPRERAHEILSPK
jgi:hypothetical protein